MLCAYFSDLSRGFFIQHVGEAQLRITRLICGALDKHI